MKRNILLLIFVVTASLSYSQYKRGLINVIDSTYPKITFKYNIYNPTELTKSDFSLIENEKEISTFEFSSAQTSDAKVKKTILFLWEDIASHETDAKNPRKKFDFVRTTIGGFFEDIQGSNEDNYSVATFNRDKNGKLLNDLGRGFTTDISELITEINAYKQSTAVFNPSGKATDLYKAIDDGLDLLIAEKQSAKALIVFTAGLNLDVAGSKSELTPIVQKAIKNEIPIYVICYRIAGVTGKAIDLAEKSYGAIYEYPNVNISEIVGNINKVVASYTYTFTFNTTQQKDGKSHNVTLNIGKEPQTITFNSPAKTTSDWISENTILFIIIIIVTIILIVAIILIIVLTSKKKKKKQQQVINNLESEQQRIAEQTKRDAEQSRQQINEYQKKLEQEKLDAANTEQNKQLANLMKIKNLYPRLQVNINSQTTTFNISAVTTTIGRTTENDLVLDSPTVSRKHTQIVFNGAAFDIIDLQSTNHVIVNGSFVQKTTLKNGDMICLGEVIITFYC